jgi:AcrR family transcriptional regulator
VAKGLLFYYFGSKRGYYVAVVEAAAAELRERTLVAEGLSAGVEPRPARSLPRGRSTLR